MINQVGMTSFAHDSAFKDFSKPKNGYYINTPYYEEVKEKKNHSLGKAIGISALVLGFGTFAIFGGGLNKGAAKFLNKLKGKLEQKIVKGGKFQNFYRYSIGKIESFISKTESINNFTTMKDVLCQRLMWGKSGNRKFTRGIHEYITKFFDKISRNTVSSAYSDTNKKFSNLTEFFTSTNERLLREHAGDANVASIIDGINTRMARVNSNLEKGFGINARNERLKDIRRGTDGLFDFFWNASLSDVRNFKNKNMWQSFIAEDYMMPVKMQLANKTGVLRQAITHNIDDTYKATMKAVGNIQKFINPSDIKTNEALNLLRSNLAKYSKLSGKEEEASRIALNSEIIQNLKTLVQNYQNGNKSFGYNEKAVEAISNYVKEVESIISKSSKGELQEILSAYKKILPDSEYRKLKSQVNAAIKSLDKSIDIETVQYVDKARDLRLGSAPTDVISVVGTVGAVGYYLGKAETKDDKVSASLKYGIPAVSAIATSLYCAARLVSGGKAMALGLLSGWIMNKAGVVVDDARKKYTLDVSFTKNKQDEDVQKMFKAQSDKV